MPGSEVSAQSTAAKPKPAKRVLYFINETVEDLLRRYIWTGCTDVSLRDQIMSHATELIRQIIRKQGLHTIYPGQDDSSFNDLIHTGWAQVERVLYKFRAKPHCRKCFNPDRPNDSALYIPGDLEYGIITYERMWELGIKKCKKCNTVLSDTPVVQAEQDVFGGSETVLFKGNSKVFNMWSQVSRTVILAHIKKEGRDKKNSGIYKDHVSGRSKVVDTSDNSPLSRFIEEARVLCQYHTNYLRIIDAISELSRNDDKLSDSLVSKIVSSTGIHRPIVTAFFDYVRLSASQFTDSPIGKSNFSSYAGRSTVQSEEDD